MQPQKRQQVLLEQALCLQASPPVQQERTRSQASLRLDASGMTPRQHGWCKRRASHLLLLLLLLLERLQEAAIVCKAVHSLRSRLQSAFVLCPALAPQPVLPAHGSQSMTCVTVPTPHRMTQAQITSSKSMA